MTGLVVGVPTGARAEAPPAGDPVRQEQAGAVEPTPEAEGETDPDGPILEPVAETVVRAKAPTVAGRRAPTARSFEIGLDERVEVDADLGDALEGLPPVGLHRYGGGLTTFSLRGSASHQTRVEVGGFPLTPLGGGSIDLSGLDPSLFSRAEVIAGPQGAAFGAGALGGVLALSPWGGATDASPTVLELKGGSHHRADLSLRQSLGEGARLALTASRSQGDFAYERDLTPNLAGDPWIEERRLNNTRTEGGLLFSGRGRALGGRYQLLGLTTRRRQALPGPVGYPTPGAGADNLRALVGASFVGPGRRPGLPRPQARAYLRLERLVLWPGHSPQPGAARELRSTLLEAGGISHADLSLGAHRLELGLALEGSRLEGELDDGRVVGALFFTDRVYLLSDRLLLSAGARLELPTGLGPQPSFTAGATYRLGEHLRLQGSVGRSVRLPTLIELHRESPLTAPNPDLLPESALAADLGLELALASGKVELLLSTFASRYRDLITYELYPPLKLRATNLRAALIAGVESRLLISPWTGVSAELGHTYTHSRSLRDDPNERGQTLPYRPAHRGHLRLGAERGLLSGHLTVEARSALQRNRAGTKSLPARALLHLGLRARLARACSLALQLDNLLNDRRQEDVHGYPLPGRTFLTSLRCNFAAQGKTP